MRHMLQNIKKKNKKNMFQVEYNVILYYVPPLVELMLY